MTILIVEDEELAIKRLKKIITAIEPDIQIAGITHSVKATVDWLKNNPSPSLILMDVELTDGQSFDVFEQIKVNSPVIFITSYDEHALKAFKVSSIDYLLKPIEKEDLESALRKHSEMKTLYSSDRLPGAENIDFLLKELKQKLHKKEFRKRFLVKHAQKMVSVEVEDIAYFLSEGRLIFFKTYGNKKFIVDYSMEELEEMLDPEKFFRINRSHMVSINSVEQINEYFGYRLQLNLKPAEDKEVIVSREKVTDFKKWLGK
jgi:DNA-binding LytR/AlgR family response regulator